MRNTTLYHQEGTTTLRRSSKGFDIGFGDWKYTVGTNLQNVEKELRRVYIADGYIRAQHFERCVHYLKTGKWDHFTEEELNTIFIFNQVDQAGAEALVVAYLCRAGSFRDLFIHGVKPHVFVALHLFSNIWQEELNKQGKGDFKIDIREFLEMPISQLQSHAYWKVLDKVIKSSDNWEPSRRYYYMGKKVCHAGNYGMQANTFRLAILKESRGQIVLSGKDAEKYISFYHTLFPEISEWHREIQQQLERTRVLYNLFGFERYFGIDELNENMFKEAYAFIPQSTIGCITAKAYTKMQGFIEETSQRWDLMADTHDSYMTQTLIPQSVECLKIMKSFIEQDLVSPIGTPFKMKSEAQHGFNWAPAKPDKDWNLDGLYEVKL